MNDLSSLIRRGPRQPLPDELRWFERRNKLKLMFINGPALEPIVDLGDGRFATLWL